MFKYWLIVFCISIIIVKETICQGDGLDLSFCDPSKIPADPRNLTIPSMNFSKFQMIYEVNSDGYTKETKEFYDSELNVAISIETIANVPVQTFAYYDTNELVIFTGENCGVFNLSDSKFPILDIISGTSQQHLLPGLIYIESLANFIFIGKDKVRTIPVNRWQACIFNPSDNSTNKVTVSYSDSTLWKPPITDSNQISVIIEVLVEKKLRNANQSSDSIISVSSFRPFIEANEDDLLPPKGIYCPNKKNTKPIPQLVNSISYKVKQIIPAKLPGLPGVVFYINQIYDYQSKIFKYEELSLTNVHDFTTGLAYIKEPSQCVIANITETFDSTISGGYVQMRNITYLFDLDGSDAYYVGKRTVMGIKADVWIGNTTVDGSKTTIEWYFIDSSWATQLPTPLLIHFKFSTNSQLIDTYNYVYEFQKYSINYDDFDVSACFKNLSNKEFVFTLPAQAFKVKNYLKRFKHGAIVALKNVAKVVPLRIAHIEVLTSCTKIFVGFTLYDRSKYYGNVPVPQNDLPLTDAINNLKSFFQQNQLEITVDNLADEVTKTIYADKNSLIESNSTIPSYSLLRETYVNSVASCGI